MSLTMEYWYLFPISILIATIAMASGIGGAVFFSPLFMLVLKLDPAVAIGTALMTELFGFSSGFYAYWRRRLIDFKLGRGLLLFSIPAAVVGSLSTGLFPASILKTIFAVGIIFIGWQLYSSYRHEEKERLNKQIEDESRDKCQSVLIDAAGNEYRYTIANKNEGRVFAAIGGWFLGMISVGLAELQEYELLARCRVPSPVAVATSIFVVVVTVLIASAGHFYNFATSTDANVLTQVVSIVTFTIPGVVVGGQVGPVVQARVNPDVTTVGIAFLFVAVGIFMLTTLV
jgi:uncharacterized membrane protein YfcA